MGDTNNLIKANANLNSYKQTFFYLDNLYCDLEKQKLKNAIKNRPEEEINEVMKQCLVEIAYFYKITLCKLHKIMKHNENVIEERDEYGRIYYRFLHKPNYLSAVKDSARELKIKTEKTLGEVFEVCFKELGKKQLDFRLLFSLEETLDPKDIEVDKIIDKYVGIISLDEALKSSWFHNEHANIDSWESFKESNNIPDNLLSYAQEYLKVLIKKNSVKLEDNFETLENVKVSKTSKDLSEQPSQNLPVSESAELEISNSPESEVSKSMVQRYSDRNPLTLSQPITLNL